MITDDTMAPLIGGKGRQRWPDSEAVGFDGDGRRRFRLCGGTPAMEDDRHRRRVFGLAKRCSR
jgi:hypothetical protein